MQDFAMPHPLGIGHIIHIMDLGVGTTTINGNTNGVEDVNRVIIVHPIPIFGIVDS